MTELTADDKRIRAQQALDAITNASWVFAEYIEKQQKRWMGAPDTTDGKEEREQAWRNVHVALSLKLELASVINNYQDEEALRAARNRRNND